MVRDGDSALQEGKAPAASTFTELDKNDLREFHRLYNFPKVDRVDSTIETCVSNGITPQELFDDLRTQYKITHLPDREGAARRFSDLVPEATEDDVESAPRLSEIHGFSESDALRALKRRLGGKHSSSLLSEEQLERSTRPAIIHDASLLEAGAAADDDHHQQTTRLYSGPSREAIDAVMAEECRKWVAQVIGEAYNADVLRETNFLDALRSGVVLLLLLQKLQDPPVPDPELKVPKRSRGFYARDNVATFLKQAAARYQLVEAQLFTDSDLCDGKNDRAVVTCLLSIARIAYTRGSTKFAPAMIIFEQEIEAKVKNLSQQQIDRVILEAEASEVNSESQDIVEGEGEGGEENELEEKEDTCIIQRPIRLLAYEEMSPTVVVVKKEEGDENETQNKNVLIEPQDDKITTVPSIEESGMITTNNEARKKEKENTPAETSCRISYRRGSVIKSDPAIGGGGDGDAPHVKEATSLLLPPNSKLEEKTEPNTVSAPDTKGGTGERNSPKATRYNPRRWDEIDISISVIVNDHFKKHPKSQIRFRRLSASAGEYVVYHRFLGHKRLMFARILQNQLMIRQFSPNIKTKVSAWDDLGSFLKRYEDEFKL